MPLFGERLSVPWGAWGIPGPSRCWLALWITPRTQRNVVPSNSRSPACAPSHKPPGPLAPDAAVRRAAVSALGRMGDTWSVTLLARALDRSKDPEECRAVESALIGLRGGAQTDRAIIAALNNSSGNTRATLISVIARREGPAAN